jgi:hypothetical protein
VARCAKPAQPLQSDVMSCADALIDKIDNAVMDTTLLSRLPGLLDRLQPGVLWVSHLGLVHHSNPEAMCRTGVRSGDRVPGGDLLRAVVEAVHHRLPRRAVLCGRPAQAGDLEPQLACEVLPGLSDDDALVMLGEPAHATGLDTELLMQLVADDLRQPLQQAQLALSVCAHQDDAQGVAVLVDEVEALLHGLDRLLELATLWPGMTGVAQDRLDPERLLRQAWSDVAGWPGPGRSRWALASRPWALRWPRCMATAPDCGVCCATACARRCMPRPRAGGCGWTTARRVRVPSWCLLAAPCSLACPPAAGPPDEAPGTAWSNWTGTCVAASWPCTVPSCAKSTMAMSETS